MHTFLFSYLFNNLALLGLSFGPSGSLAVECEIQFSDQGSNSAHWELRASATGPPGTTRETAINYIFEGLS